MIPLGELCHNLDNSKQDLLSMLKAQGRITDNISDPSKLN